MKRFFIKMAITMFVIGMLEFSVDANFEEPKTTLAAYHNKITNIAYDYDRSSIILSFEFDPICIYTPLTYENGLHGSITKTYFLPRTTYVGMKKKYHRVRHILESFGISMEMYEVIGKHYGVHINFIMQSDANDVIKIINGDKKEVRFDIFEKI